MKAQQRPADVRERSLRRLFSRLQRIDKACRAWTVPETVSACTPASDTANGLNYSQHSTVLLQVQVQTFPNMHAALLWRRLRGVFIKICFSEKHRKAAAAQQLIDLQRTGDRVVQLFAIRSVHPAQPRNPRNVAAWCFLRDRHLKVDVLHTPSWSGACYAADRAKLESFISWCKRLGYCSLHTANLSVMLTKVLSNASSNTMHMFNDHSYRFSHI